MTVKTKERPKIEQVGATSDTADPPQNLIWREFTVSPLLSVFILFELFLLLLILIPGLGNLCLLENELRVNPAKA